MARIDAELADEHEDTANGDPSGDFATTNGHGKARGGGAEWDFSGWPMLLLLMPPVGFVTIAQPIMNWYVDRRLLAVLHRQRHLWMMTLCVSSCGVAALPSHCARWFAFPVLSRLGFRFSLPEPFLLLPVLLLIGIPAYQVFAKGDTRSGAGVATGALGEGLTSGDGLADQSDKIDLYEPSAPPVASHGGEPTGPPPEATSNSRISR